MNCGYSFFAPEIIQSPSEKPFFRSPTGFYGDYFHDDRASDNPMTLEEVNLDEWMTYFRGAVPRTQLSFLLYKMTLNYLGDLIASMEGKDVPLATEAQAIKTAVMSYGSRDRVIRSLRYLDIAKRVEPIATRAADGGWNSGSQAKQVDADEAKRLIDVAESRIKNADKFIAERYRFQVIRLIYYSGRYVDAQNYFEQYKGIFTSENS